jgi:HPt (histidine-containing phosphotransfer) domain-containing protein
MLFDNDSLDATLTAAAGEDASLLAELRTAFADSLARQLDLLKRSRCDGNWTMAAMRLKGLAASFHAAELIALADEALTCAPGDPVVVRRVEGFLTRFNVGRG